MNRNVVNISAPEAPADAQGLVHRGLAYTRTAQATGPVSRRELQFAQAWQRENLRQSGLTGALDAMLRAQDESGLTSRDAPRPVPLDQNAATIAATAMQWLGSAQGFQYLADALEAAGYRLVDAATGVTQAAGKRLQRCKREAIRERYVIDATPNIVEDAPVRYYGTVDGTTVTSGVSTAEQAMADALSAMLNGKVLEQLALRLTACATGYAGRQANAEQVSRYAERCMTLADKALADLDVQAAEPARERLERAIAEWHRKNPAAAPLPMRKVA